MLVQYIEDSKIDADCLTRLADKSGAFAVHVSGSIDEFEKCAPKEDNPILVDVLRPDSVSIEDDVERLRQYTSAPIAFITGGNAAAIRDRAIKAGAVDILDKARMTADLINEVFGHQMPGAAPPEELDDAIWVRTELLPNHHLSKLAASLEYLEDRMRVLMDPQEKEDSLSNILEHEQILNTVTTLRSFAESDLSQSTVVGWHDVFRDVEHDNKHLAASKSVTLKIDCEHVWTRQIGSHEITQSGMHHLLQALLLLMPNGSLVRMNIEKRRGGAYLSIFLNAPVCITRDTFFEGTQQSGSVHLASQSSFRLAALLLSLREEQVSVQNLGIIQLIRISL